MKTHLYDYDKEFTKAHSILSTAKLRDEDRKHIQAFIGHLQALGISKARLLRYMVILRHAGTWLSVPFRQATRSDIVQLIATAESQSWTEWTKVSFRIAIKRFYKWLSGNDETYPPTVSWIKGTLRKDRQNIPQQADLVNEQDIQALLQHSHHPRDKAFIALLWESGGRIGEIGTLRIKDILFDRYGCLVHVHGKTGPRQVRIIQATPYLAGWLSHHPKSHDLSARLWTSTSNSNRGSTLAYQALRKLLKTTFERAGIKKKSNPHAFRHARATYLANHLTEFQMNQHFGWVQGSDMPCTYVHLTGRDTDDTLLRLNGITPDKKQQHSTLRPHLCPRCNTINQPDSMLCRNCGLPQSTTAANSTEQQVQNEEQVLASLMKNPQFKQAFIQAFQEAKLQKPLRVAPDQGPLMDAPSDGMQ